MKMKIIVLVIVSWFFQFVVVGENATGLSISIDSVAAIDTTCMVYNCDVPVTHTYYIGNNAILAHNADVCNKLVEAVLNKLGKGYDAVGVRAGLENIFQRYKGINDALTAGKLTEEQLINNLAKLISGNVCPASLSSFLTGIGSDFSKANQFAKDINTFQFLDDMSKNGSLLGKYADVEKDIKNVFEVYNEMTRQAFKNKGVKLSPQFYSYLAAKATEGKDIWKTYATTVEGIMAAKVTELKALYPNAKIGFRGSLSSGVKYGDEIVNGVAKEVKGLKFDPKDWDVDAFIVDDVLAADVKFSNVKFGGFKNGNDVSMNIKTRSQQIENLLKNQSGYRTSIGREFTFAIWSNAEYNAIISKTNHKIL
jgi:hypothetical protein